MLSFFPTAGRSCTTCRAAARPKRRYQTRAQKSTHRCQLEGLEARQLLSTPNWGAFPQQIGQDDAATYYPFLTGTGESVVVLDTGAYLSHPSFSGGSGISGTKIAYWQDFVGSSSTPVDTIGHGTGVAGIIAGNGYTYGGSYYQGIAPGVNLIVLRTANTKAGWNTEGARIVQALDWVIANQHQYNIVAVNMSTGQGLFSDTSLTGDKYASVDAQLAQRFATLDAAGVFLGAAAGNDGATAPNTDEYPAADPNVFAAGSVDGSDNASTYASRGAMTDILAPADNNYILPYYLSSQPGTYYIQGGPGTSWASPQMVGTAALLKQIDSTLTPDQIMQIMEQAGQPITDPTTGNTIPRLNVGAAIAQAYRVADDLYNHSTANATTLSFSGNTASMSGLKSLLYAQDYYKFTLATGADVTFGMRTTGTDPGITYSLVSSSGSVVQAVSSGQSVVLPAGTWYLRENGGTSTLVGSYAIGLTLTNDDAPSNHSLGSALPISISAGQNSVSNLTVLPGLDDYFSFTLTGTTDVTLSLSTPASYPTVQFLNSSGSSIASIGQSGYSQRLPAGTYYIHVSSTTDLVGYGINIGATPYVTPPGANASVMKVAYSPNGTLQMAWFDSVAKTLKWSQRSPGGAWSTPVTVDTSPNAGKYLSIGVDPTTGNPGIAYYDATRGVLKYAGYNGSRWYTTTVDTSGSGVGQYPSLAFTSTGQPVIAYYVAGAGDLRVAGYSGGKWYIVTIDSAGNVGRSPSIAYDGAINRWGVGYEDVTHGWEKYATLLSGSTHWVNGAIDTATKQAGGSISLAWDKLNRPAMSYYDQYNKALKFARYDGSKWNVSTLGTNQGTFTNLSFDADNDPDIIYYNAGAGAVFSAKQVSNSWSLNSVASGGFSTSADRNPTTGNLTAAWIANNVASVLDL